MVTYSGQRSLEQAGKHSVCTGLESLAETLNNLGLLDSDQKRADEARKKYEEALQIYQSFAKQDPQEFSSDVTMVKELLAKLPAALGP